MDTQPIDPTVTGPEQYLATIQAQADQILLLQHMVATQSAHIQVLETQVASPVVTPTGTPVNNPFVATWQHDMSALIDSMTIFDTEIRSGNPGTLAVLTQLDRWETIYTTYESIVAPPELTDLYHQWLTDLVDLHSVQTVFNQYFHGQTTQAAFDEALSHYTGIRNDLKYTLWLKVKVLT